MKKLITFIALLTSTAVSGQDNLKPDVSKDFNRLQLGINISPDYAYRTLKNSDGSATSSQFIILRNKQEGYKIGYTAGLNVTYNLSKSLGIELGVQYSNKGYEIDISDLLFGDVLDPRYGFTYDPVDSAKAPSKVTFRYNHIYLDVPLRAIFSFGERRIKYIASIGVTTNVLLKATQTSIFKYKNGDTKRNTQDQQHDFKSINISPTISVGVDYKISERLNLRVEPTFRYGILKIIDAPVTSYLWNGGINISCYYILK